MKRIYDENKIDVSIAPQSVSGAVTGSFFPMKNTRTVAFPFYVGAMAVGNTVAAQVVQATDSAGSGVKDVSGAACTLTANVNVSKATVTLATFTAGSTIVINGLTFTAHATVTTVANREFSIAGTDTQDAVQLVTCINDATYGVPGVTASSAAGVVTLVATNAGEASISVTGVATIGVAATVMAVGYVEVSTDLLDTNNGFIYAALKLTNSAALNVAAGLVSDRSRYQNTQYLGAVSLNN